LALRVGVFLKHHELELAVAPSTYIIERSIYPDGHNIFEVAGMYRYFIPLHEGPKVQVYWPMAAGFGFLWETGSNVALFEARADLVGIAVKFNESMMLELHAPSFRYATSNACYGLSYPGDPTPCEKQFAHVFTWLFAIGASYVF